MRYACGFGLMLFVAIGCVFSGVYTAFVTGEILSLCENELAFLASTGEIAAGDDFEKMQEIWRKHSGLLSAFVPLNRVNDAAERLVLCQTARDLGDKMRYFEALTVLKLHISVLRELDRPSVGTIF